MPPVYLPEGYGESTRTRRVRHDDDGKLGGFQVDHWDGRLDARILARPVRIGLNIVQPTNMLEPHRRRKLNHLLRRLPRDERGAITASGLFVLTFIDIFDATQLAFAYLADTMKVALYPNTITPNFSTDVGYGAGSYATALSGGSWAAAGYTLATKTIAEDATGSVVFDAADVSQATSTIAAARGGLVYDDTLASDQGVCLINFGSDYSCTNGTFAITFATPANGGVFYFDLTP